MAELILTEEEQAAATWLELDDATIGKLVKKTALGLVEQSDEQKRVWWFSAAMLLCGITADANARSFSQEINGFTRAGEDQGDWRISVERLDVRQAAPSFEANPEWMETAMRLVSEYADAWTDLQCDGENDHQPALSAARCALKRHLGTSNGQCNSILGNKC